MFETHDSNRNKYPSDRIGYATGNEQAHLRPQLWSPPPCTSQRGWESTAPLYFKIPEAHSQRALKLPSKLVNLQRHENTQSLVISRWNPSEVWRKKNTALFTSRNSASWLWLSLSSQRLSTARPNNEHWTKQTEWPFFKEPSSSEPTCISVPSCFFWKVAETS